MGDRALIVFTNNDRSQFSPVVYLHWHGDSVPALIAKTADRMVGRRGDVGYAAARFCGICHETIDGNLSLGIVNADVETIKSDPASVSQGGAGFVIVNCDDFTWTAHGSYLEGKR